MSDQDFFFDEEDEKPATPAPKAAAKSGAKAAAKSGAKSAPAKKPAGDSTQAAPVEAAPASFFDTPVAMSIVAMVVLCALLIGLIIGVLVGQSRAESAAAAADTSTAIGATSGQTAPQLTQDQLNSGQLPAGHPSIGGSGAATGSPSATGTK